jgi:SAM-dependent MidA family methyltransferase
MQLALYHPQFGYYTRNKKRVGYGGSTDFFTASTSGKIFGELVVAACTSLLAGAPAEHDFVEIGAEPGAGILDGVAHPFRSARTVRLGETLELTGRCVVFSNELFDAQPFHRFRYARGGWQELGVALEEGRLVEVPLPEATPCEFPAHPSEGYVLDAPLEAARLAARLAAQPWTGLFVAFDYGKSWQELGEATPHGTARAYFRHTQSNDLLSQPGEQDLTCHVCWDWLCEALQARGFGPTSLESQESFFVHHAGTVIADAIAGEGARFSQRKLSILQLLHPAHLGQRFQVLHTKR